ncbi:MAG: trigger factor [Anaerovoracaceae bacterium]
MDREIRAFEDGRFAGAEQAAAGIVRQVAFPGFRKGKYPAPALRRNAGLQQDHKGQRRCLAR